MINWGDVVILATILVLVIGALYFVIRDKRKGRCSCGGGCKNCGCNCNSPIVPKTKE